MPAPMDASAGKVLWGFSSGGSVLSGAAVVGGSVYWGSGYDPASCIGPCAANDKLYAFTPAARSSLPSRRENADRGIRHRRYLKS